MTGDVGRQPRTWDVMRDRFPLGHPTGLGTVDAPTYKQARELAEARWGKNVLVLARSRRSSSAQEKAS